MPHPVKKNMGGNRKGGRGGKGRGKGGGGGRGRGGRGRGGRGGAGRGRGGAGRGAVVRQGPPQVRLFYMKQHIILKTFNYLDEESRKNVFEVMGWSMDNYWRRKEMMKKQMENVERMKLKKQKEEEEAKKKQEEEEEAKKAKEEEEAGDEVVFCQEIKNEADDTNGYGEKEKDVSLDVREDEAAAAAAAAAPEGDEVSWPKKDVEPKRADLPLDSDDKPIEEESPQALVNDLNKLAMAVNAGWDDDDDKEKDGNAKEEAEAKDDAKSSKDETANVTKDDDNAKEKTEGGDTKNDKVEETKEGEQKEEEIPVKLPIEDHMILPPLFARVDANTLLDRLNTRRLFSRILWYKREERKKIEREAELMGKDGDGGDEQRAVSIKEMYDAELKLKMTLNRVYRKDLDIQEMADLEWDELLEMAEVRLNGDEVPFDPIPTQYELLMFQQCPRAVGILASYPRSGNSLMRTLYEHTTLRVTGSDMQGGLAKHDLVGEMAVGANMVQFVKTHFPERQGTPPFRASRVVLLVRNPFDCIESYFNLMMTGTHTTSITQEVREKSKAYFDEYVMKEVRVWKMFHQFWMNQDVPILLIRYEDLVRNPKMVMARVLQFVLEVKRMGTFFTERIERCVGEQERIERMGSYKPRSGGIGKSLSKYSPELVQKMKDDKQLNEIMGHLGYGELLSKPPEEWSSLKPLDDYATEYLPSWHKTPGKEKVVLLNKGRLARGPEEQTPWNKIKRELGLVDKECNCEKCQAMKKRGGTSSPEEEKKEASGEQDGPSSEEKKEAAAVEQEAVKTEE